MKPGLWYDKQSRSFVIIAKPSQAFVISQSLASVYYNKGLARHDRKDFDFA